MIVLDVNVNDVHRPIELAAAIEQILSGWLASPSRVKGLVLTVANSIITPLLAGDNNIRDLLTLLPSFGCQFNIPVPIEHLQQTAGRVSKVWMSL